MPLSRAAEAFADALLEDDPVALYERAPCGYLSTTPDGVIVKVNRTFSEWTGYTADELVGRSLVSLLTPGGRIFYETHYAPMVRLQGFARELAVDLLCSDDSRLAVLLNARLVARAIRLDGTCSGEHGIGMHKMDFLMQEAGLQAVELMRAIKRVFDPQNILNPGKVLWGEAEQDAPLRRSWAP